MAVGRSLSNIKDSRTFEYRFKEESTALKMQRAIDEQAEQGWRLVTVFWDPNSAAQVAWFERAAA